jgi:hypothetical protein
MATQCHNQLTLGFQSKIVLDFNGGQITSDSGLLLLRQFDEQLALTQKLRGLLNDWRHPGFIEHSTDQMLCQRIYQIAAGYEDCDDADTLRTDPTFQSVVGKADPLASQPTLSRLENHADWQSIRRLSQLCLKWFIQHGYNKRETAREILLDSDCTDDPCHGQQVFAFFHGKYGQHMYHPLYFFEAKTGCLLSARLRPGNASASEAIAVELKRLVPILRRRFPKSQISYRADAGSATPTIYASLESLQVLYAIGIGTHAVFQRRTERWLKRAKRKYARGHQTVRFFIALGTEPEAGPNTEKLSLKLKSVLWAPICALWLPTERAEPSRSLTITRIEDSVRIASRSLSATFNRTGCPATSIALMPFGFSSMRLLINCWCSFVCTHLKKLTSLRFDCRAYDSSYSKSAPALSAVLAACGFISLRAGQDAICSWRSGKNLNACLSLHPIKSSSLRLHFGPVHPRRQDVVVFLPEAFFAPPAPQSTTLFSLA